MNKVRFFTIFMVISLSMVSCGIIGSDNPCEKHIEKQQMIDILTEIYLLEAHVSHQQTGTNIRDSLPHLYGGLLQKYGVSAEQFETAFECYMLNRDLMNNVLDEVLSNLSIARSKADEKKEEEQNEEEDTLPTDTIPADTIRN